MGLETDSWASWGLRGATKVWMALFPTLVINCAHLDEENPQEAQVKNTSGVSIWRPMKWNMFSLVIDQWFFFPQTLVPPLKHRHLLCEHLKLERPDKEKHRVFAGPTEVTKNQDLTPQHLTFTTHGCIIYSTRKITLSCLSDALWLLWPNLIF